MDSPPVPKPRSLAPSQNPSVGAPTPLPRHVVPTKEKVDSAGASDILSTLSTKSKQFTEGVATKISNSAKGTLEKTKTTSRAVRDTVTKSVIEGTTAGMKLLKPKKTDTAITKPESQRSTSMPDGDVNLFENISFISPLQRRYMSDFREIDEGEPVSLHLNNTNFDDLSLFSSNSDVYTDSISDLDPSNMQSLVMDLTTYDTPRGSRTNSVASSYSFPEAPERKKSLEKNRQSTSYENYQLPNYFTPLKAQIKPAPEPKQRPSNSTICEFDPLNDTTTCPGLKGVSNEHLLQESYLMRDTFGSVVAIDNSEDCLEYVENDYFNPPCPPERFDSLAELNRQDIAAAVVDERHSNWYITEDGKENKTAGVEVKRSNSMAQMFNWKQKLDNVLHKPVKSNEPKFRIVERPPISDWPAPYFSGNVMKSATLGLEELFKTSQSRYCVLSEQKLVCYSDPTNAVVKEIHHLNSIYCVQVVLPLSSSATNTYSFELQISAETRVAPRKHLFTCNSISERRNWLQKIAEHLAAGFPPRFNAEYNIMGWCYLKEGVTGEWCGAWLMLVRRELLYYIEGREPGLVVIDLRKTTCVVTQAATPEANQTCPSDDSPHLLLDCQHGTIYLRFSHEKLLKFLSGIVFTTEPNQKGTNNKGLCYGKVIASRSRYFESSYALVLEDSLLTPPEFSQTWRYMIKLAAQTNGAYIHHQQLTHNDVPTIVEKCISFIYAYGSLSEGIYRRNGGNCTIGELLADFRHNAWAVQLSPNQHSEHDVAGTLKRFLRNLPYSLIPEQQHKALIHVLVIDDDASRFEQYRHVMASLPLVARQTTRKLFAHLHFLHTMSHANKMHAENLAAVWAPTIMPPSPTTNNAIQDEWGAKLRFVVRDLITNFESIWETTESEKRREGSMRNILLRVLSNSAPGAHKAAGDLRAWIYVKDKSACFQVALSPNKTSADVCIELCDKANIDSHMLMLEEVICNESMRRVVHIDELVLDVVLRWGYWDEDDRKNNYLVVKENSLLHEIEALKKSNTSLLCGELKIATESTKAFKLHMFEFQHSCLCYFKDKQGSHKIEEWNIKDILWYIGHEPKRNPQSRWAITFISRNKQKRSKDKPWFGCTIAGAVNDDRLKWMSAMMFSEHANILPTPRLVIT